MRSLTLDVAVPREHQPEILKNLYWVDSGIEAFAFDPADGRQLAYRYKLGPVPDRLDSRVKDSANRLARSLQVLPSKTIFEQTPKTRGCANPYDELCLRGWIRPAAAGTHLYGGLFFELFQALDLAFLQAARRLDVAEFKFPSLISAETLAQSGYLDGFPHHANFVCHLPEQAELVEQFKLRLKSREDRAAIPLEHLCDHAGAALSPTVCYHFYQCHAGCVVPRASLFSATAQSPCYRFEGKAMRGLRRLREFNMREIIFLGAAERVKSRHDALVEAQKTLLQRCELHSAIRTASDPFFLDSYDKKRVFQLSFDLKYETQAWLPHEEEWLAIGSVNYHQDHFGKAFRITLDTGEPAHSCCLGFGLDRWCLAIFAQHGLEPEHWPAGVREILEAHRSTKLAGKEGGAQP